MTTTLMATADRYIRPDLTLSPYHHTASGATVLVASREPDIRGTFERGLQADRHDLRFASTGYEALQEFQKQRPDLILLDVELPGISSWEVCRYLLGKARVPVVFLAPAYREDDAIRALQLGAVDYVTKAASPQVLLARARAALRRNDVPLPAPAAEGYRDEYLEINLAAHEVLVEGKPVQLTTTEYNLLVYLLKKAGQICSKDQILKQIWGAGYETCLHYVHLYIGRLRKKIERAPSQPEYLISVYGKGYCFRLSEVSAH